MQQRLWSVAVVLALMPSLLRAQDSPNTTIAAGETLAAEQEQARSDYLAAVAAAQKKLRASLAELEQRIKVDRKLKPAEKLSQLDQFDAERERFESQGTVPTLPGFKRLVETYHKELRPARSALEKAFDGIADRVLKVDQDAAEAVLLAKPAVIDSAGPTTAALEDSFAPSGPASHSKINAFAPADWVLPRNRGFLVTSEGWLTLTRPDALLTSKQPWPPGHEVVVTLSAAAGTRAFITLGTDGKVLIGAPIADDGQQILAGMQAHGLDGRPKGIEPKPIPYDEPFVITLRKVSNDLWVRVNDKITSGATWGKKGETPGTPVGTVSVLLKQGRLTIRKLEVRPAP